MPELHLSPPSDRISSRLAAYVTCAPIIGREIDGGEGIAERFEAGHQPLAERLAGQPAEIAGIDLDQQGLLVFLDARPGKARIRQDRLRLAQPLRHLLRRDRRRQEHLRPIIMHLARSPLAVPGSRFAVPGFPHLAQT